MNRGGFGQPITRPFGQNNFAIPAGFMVYEYTAHVSGPVVAGDPTNMATTGATADVPSIFEHAAPPNTELRIARLNFAILDGNPNLQSFGGLGALANGCKLEVVNADGLVILHLDGGRPFQANKDFLYAAGIDMVIVNAAAGQDVVKVRFTLRRAGAAVILMAGDRIRWTIQDDLNGITEFRCQAQGTMTR